MTTTTTKKHDLIVPTVHMNGTNRESLLEQREVFYQAICGAAEALKQMAPHGRDYYIAEPGTFERATAQHERRQKTLDSLAQEILDEARILQE